MNRLSVSAIITALAGAAILIGATVTRSRVWADTPILQAPDYSGVDLWTTIGFALLGLAFIAAFLAMHAELIRNAISSRQ